MRGGPSPEEGLPWASRRSTRPGSSAQPAEVRNPRCSFRRPRASARKSARRARAKAKSICATCSVQRGLPRLRARHPGAPRHLGRPERARAPRAARRSRRLSRRVRRMRPEGWSALGDRRVDSVGSSAVLRCAGAAGGDAARSRHGDAGAGRPRPAGLHAPPEPRTSDWVGGAYVFPGGAVDPGDREPAVLARCPDRDDADASAQLGADRRAGSATGSPACARRSRRPACCWPGRPATGALVDPSRAAARDPAATSSTPASLTFEEMIESEDLLLDVGAHARLLALDHARRGTTAATTPGSSSWPRPTGTRTSTTTTETVASHLGPPGRRARRRRRGASSS